MLLFNQYNMVFYWKNTSNNPVCSLYSHIFIIHLQDCKYYPTYSEQLNFNVLTSTFCLWVCEMARISFYVKHPPASNQSSKTLNVLATNLLCPILGNRKFITGWLWLKEVVDTRIQNRRAEPKHADGLSFSFTPLA